MGIICGNEIGRIHIDIGEGIPLSIAYTYQLVNLTNHVFIIFQFYDIQIKCLQKIYVYVYVVFLQFHNIKIIITIYLNNDDKNILFMYVK